jgi:hypothetical protein
MDSGWGAIGRKLVKQFVQGFLAFLRLERPGINTLLLGAIFYILGFHFQLEGIGQFSFENFWIGFFAGCFFYCIPVLLYLNSALFRSVQLTSISRIISGCLCVIMAFSMLGSLLGIMFGLSGTLIHTK